jgi:hypothetical protein
VNKDAGHLLNLTMNDDYDLDWEQMPGEWTVVEYMDGKVTPRHYAPDIKKSTEMHESITFQTNFVLGKIEEKTITVDDINRLISESLPSSAVDRVNRRTIRNSSDSHIDNKTGDQPLSPVPKRPSPERQPSDRTKLYGRAKQGRRKSAKTNKREARRNPDKFTEAVEFINKFVNKPANDYNESLSNIQNKNALFKIITRLLRNDNININRDWVWEIRESIKLEN